MKKELLWALRDYSYSALQLQYKDYPDGIILGCGIRIEDNTLCITQGIIKCQEFVFLLTDEERIEYAPTEEYVCLKFRLVKKEVLPDYTRYITEFVLDESVDRKQNEIEICRFKLKEGARLRTDYKDFFDIQTEFDTVNLADATWAASGGNTLSKEVTDYFARKVLECEEAEDKDIQFAYFLLQSREAACYDILLDYIIRKEGKKSTGSLRETFRSLENILDGIKKGTNQQRSSRMAMGNKMIILD
ncbi:MAG: hypothetical protein J1F18_08110 [Lachnospiraceae bacterium]|nr:hypothetical protein [Lachnospiraceae bacterium]